MNKGNKIYEGKAKIIYETKDKNLVIQHFKDDATAFNNLKKSKVIINSELNTYAISNASNLILTEGAISELELILNKV